MKILSIHADFIEFAATKKAFKGAEENVDTEKHRVEECLVIFTAVEKRDEANPEAVLNRYKKEVKDIAAQVKAKNIVVYPYAHLSSDLAKPAVAETFLKDAEQLLKQEFTVYRAPFGWYKAFTIANKGHPLSELSREFGPEENSSLQYERDQPVISKASISANNTYKHLIKFLDDNKATYRLINHPPEGRTEIVSQMRGNKVSQAAKCIIVTIKFNKKADKHVLSVVPGDAKVNLNAIKELFGGTYASFANVKIAEKLAGSVSGTILPFSFNTELELIVDPFLLQNDELFFNAARLDCSLALKTSDYQRLAKPRLEPIAEYSKESTESSLKREYKDEPFQYHSSKLTADQQASLTTAFLVAKAVKDLFKEAQIGVLDFHHDYAFVDVSNVKLHNQDLNRLQKQVQKLIREEISITETSSQAVQSVWQQEILSDVGKKPSYQLKDLVLVPLYKNPFLNSTKELKAFKLLNLSSAYWKGNEKNQQLTRISCIGFTSAEKLQEYEKKVEEAEARSHLKIGREQGLFVVSELVGSGLPLLAPKGAIIRQEIVDFLWELHKHKDYHRVAIPHIAKDLLYKASGHWEKFGDELFLVKGKHEQFVLKPMNCPHHTQIFNNFSYSYRDLPIRFFEPTTVYRDEKPGQLLGLSRVRAITQDDGHIFCRVSQIQEEVKTIVGIILDFYKTLGMDKNYWVSLSVRGNDQSKYLGTAAVWNTAEAALEEVANANNLPYKKIKGEAAFYGPKLDFMFRDALGREWQLATIQLDFNLPERFNLSYMNEESKKERPVMIHRAISGSLERFMSILIEHFAGKFPLWLNPVQVKLVTITDRHKEFAQKIFSLLRERDIRVELDERAESMGKKVRDAQLEKVNYIVTIGDKELETQTISIRSRTGDTKFAVKIEEFLKQIVEEKNTRSII